MAREAADVDLVDHRVAEIERGRQRDGLTLEPGRDDRAQALADRRTLHRGLAIPARVADGPRPRIEQLWLGLEPLPGSGDAPGVVDARAQALDVEVPEVERAVALRIERDHLERRVAVRGL